MVTSVLFALAGDETKASARVRGFWMADELQRLGMDCTLVTRQSKHGLLATLFSLPKADAIVFQKTYSKYHYAIARFARWLGRSVFLDIDDAPSRTLSPVTLEYFGRMARLANGVFAGSPALVDYVRGFGGTPHLLPSGVRLSNYAYPRPPAGRAPVCIGWIGNGAHYAEDLITLLAEPLVRLGSVRSVSFKLVGACGVKALYEAFEAIPGVDAELVDQIAWADPNAVSAALADFDIGVYPLQDNAFNEFKCGFKALEYMAMGLPVVSSRVAVNGDIIEDGVNGYLVDSPDEWASRLIDLASDENKRMEMGLRGREKVEREYSTAAIAAKVKSIVEASLRD